MRPILLSCCRLTSGKIANFLQILFTLYIRHLSRIFSESTFIRFFKSAQCPSFHLLHISLQRRCVIPLATPANPRKEFPWTVEFEGLEPALVQRVKIPVVSVEVAEHGSSNILIKTGSIVKVSDIELNKIMFMDKNKNWAYDWLRKVSDPETARLPINIDQLKSKWIVDIRRAAKDTECALDAMMEIKCPHCKTMNTNPVVWIRYILCSIA